MKCKGSRARIGRPDGEAEAKGARGRTADGRTEKLKQREPGHGRTDGRTEKLKQRQQQQQQQEEDPGESQNL